MLNSLICLNKNRRRKTGLLDDVMHFPKNQIAFIFHKIKKKPRSHCKPHASTTKWPCTCSGNHEGFIKSQNQKGDKCSTLTLSTNDRAPLARTSTDTNSMRTLRHVGTETHPNFANSQVVPQVTVNLEVGQVEPSTPTGLSYFPMWIPSGRVCVLE